jgi:hypothetical protein
MQIGTIANCDRKTRKLDQTYLGFSINPDSGREWSEEQFSEKEQRIVKRKIKVFSLREEMSSNENPVDNYKSRGRRIGYFLRV